MVDARRWHAPDAERVEASFAFEVHVTAPPVP
jgi:hypothetical protein